MRARAVDCRVYLHEYEYIIRCVSLDEYGVHCFDFNMDKTAVVLWIAHACMYPASSHEIG